ncbi:Transmembrane protein, partial [Ophiophagus hannah]
ACVILGVIFLLSALCIVIKAIHDLATKLLPEVDDFLYSVSILSGILCTTLAVIKFMLGNVLTSRALLTDALYDNRSTGHFGVFVTNLLLHNSYIVISHCLAFTTPVEDSVKYGIPRFNSLVGGIMGFSILLSAEVFKHNASVWYLDGSIGVLIGLTIFAYGAKLLMDMVPRVRQTRHYEISMSIRYKYQ